MINEYVLLHLLFPFVFVFLFVCYDEFVMSCIVSSLCLNTDTIGSFLEGCACEILLFLVIVFVVHTWITSLWQWPSLVRRQLNSLPWIALVVL